MTGPTGALSDSPSPLRLRKTNSPFLTRAMFEAATSKSQQAQEIVEAEDSDDSNIDGTCTPPRSRRDSFNFTERIRNIRHPEMNPGNKPKDEFKVGREIPKFRRCLSKVIDSPSSESVMSKSPTSTFSADSWDDHGKSDTKNNDNNNHNINSSSMQGLSVGSTREAVVISRSQPSLSLLHIGPIARKNFRDQTIEKEKAIMQTSQMLGVPGKEWVRALQKDFNEAPSLDLDPFSPYSPGILDPGKVASAQRTTVAKTLIDLNEYCQRVDVRPKEDEDDSDEEEIQREGKKEDEKTEKGEEGDRRSVRGAIMVALEFPTLTLHIELCNIINPEVKIDISKTIEPNVSAVEERGQAISGTIKSMVGTSVDSVTNVSTLSVERTTESEAIVKRWRRDQSTSPQIQQPDILALDRDIHCQPLQNPQLSRNRRQRNRGSQGCLISSGSLQMAIEGSFHQRRTVFAIGNQFLVWIAHYRLYGYIPGPGIQP
ncbi:MAG: hypothetical protein J3Q66DRAFT_417177 [Benniella sp.]|nr:MAG: hypothetical protein J3Q66DRAFT_417177 [Benniella sp.]